MTGLPHINYKTRKLFAKAVTPLHLPYIETPFNSCSNIYTYCGYTKLRSYLERTIVISISYSFLYTISILKLWKEAATLIYLLEFWKGRQRKNLSPPMDMWIVGSEEALLTNIWHQNLFDISCLRLEFPLPHRFSKFRHLFVVTEPVFDSNIIDTTTADLESFQSRRVSDNLKCILLSR